MTDKYVYLVTMDGFPNGPVKVGFTSDPLGRLKGLQTGNPFKLRMICMERVENAPKIERKVKDVFEPMLCRGGWEWFNLSPEVARVLIRSIIDGRKVRGLRKREDFYAYLDKKLPPLKKPRLVKRKV